MQASLNEWNGVRYYRYRDLSASIYGRPGFWATLTMQQIASIGNNISESLGSHYITFCSHMITVWTKGLSLLYCHQSPGPLQSIEVHYRCAAIQIVAGLSAQVGTQYKVTNCCTESAKQLSMAPSGAGGCTALRPRE